MRVLYKGGRSLGESIEMVLVYTFRHVWGRQDENIEFELVEELQFEELPDLLILGNYYRGDLGSLPQCPVILVGVPIDGASEGFINELLRLGRSDIRFFYTPVHRESFLSAVKELTDENERRSGTIRFFRNYGWYVLGLAVLILTFWFLLL